MATYVSVLSSGAAILSLLCPFLTNLYPLRLEAHGGLSVTSRCRPPGRAAAGPGPFLHHSLRLYRLPDCRETARRCRSVVAALRPHRCPPRPTVGVSGAGSRAELPGRPPPSPGPR